MKHIITFLFSLFIATYLSAQGLQPTETKALMRVEVTDFDAKPRAKEIITFRSKKSGKQVKKITGENGSFEILLPEGDTYEIIFKKFMEESKYSEIEIKDQPGMMKSVLRIKYEFDLAADQVFALDINFFSNESRIQEKSFQLLDDLAEQMQLKPSLVIELAGHTDNVGADDYNQKLSEDRAAAVKKYLVKTGILESRILSLGYGESKPIADNGNETGKAKNRRTEVRIITP